MSEDKIIYNSFKNVTKLYEDISKMLYEMDSQFRAEKFIPNMNNQNTICRWRSDLISEISGWMVDSIARPYCLSTEMDTEMDTEIDTEENSRLIFIKINLNYEIPHLTFGLHTYKWNISNHRFGVGDYWLIDWPTNPRNNNQFSFNEENEYMIQSRPVNKNFSKTYLKLINSLFISVRLFEIKDKDTLNSLIVVPSIKLFRGEELDIKSLDNFSYLSSRDYRRLHE